MNLRRVQCDTGRLRQPFGEDARIVMVFLQAFRPFFQRHQAGRRKHTRLAHAAAQHLANRTAAFDEIARTHNHRADRRA